MGFKKCKKCKKRMPFTWVGRRPKPRKVKFETEFCKCSGNDD